MDCGAALFHPARSAPLTRPALVELWATEALLFVPDLPGFQVNAPTPELAIELARDRLDRHIEWLRESELDEHLAPGQSLTVVETLSAIGAADPIFDLDLAPADSQSCEFALAVGRAALSELLFIFDDVDPDHRRAAEQILRHVAELDHWYATRLAPASGAPFAAIEDQLIQSASLFEETIDAVASTAQSPVWDVDGESWSVRKALRRRTGHLREHLADLLALSQ